MNITRKTWLIGGFLTLLFVFCVINSNVPFLFRLWTSGQPSEATIVKVDRLNHCSADYSYMGTDKVYIGSDSGACQFAVGSKHIVYYDPENPQHSIIETTPWERLKDELTTIFLLSIILPLIILWRLKIINYTPRA